MNTNSNQITLTPERAQRYAVANAYVFDGTQITVRKDNADIHERFDLAGKRVAVNLGSNFEQILRESPVGDKVDTITDDSGIEQDVLLGRSDAFIMDRVSALSLIRKSGQPLKASFTGWLGSLYIRWKTPCRLSGSHRGKL